MGPDDSLADAERTARAVARQDDRMRARLVERGERSLRDRWVLLGSSGPSDSRPVESLPETSYRLPSHAGRILGAASLAELEAILHEVRAANDELVGLDADVAGVLAATDARVPELRARLRRWADAYAATRLARRNARDDDDPVARFKRLLVELLPALETIAVEPRSVHHVFLAELVDYAPWLLFQGTWAKWFKTDPTNKALEHRWCVAAPTPGAMSYCTEIARLYAWPSARDLAGGVRAFRERAVASAAWDAVEPGWRERVGALAAEIREVRPFLVRDHNPEKLRVEVAPGLVAGWYWGGAQQLGIVPLHDDERRRLEEHARRAFSTVVRVGYDGLVSSEHAPWLGTEALAGTDRSAVAFNVALVEALHARLLEIFANVDLGVALDRVRKDAAGARGAAVPSEEALAVTFVAAGHEAVAEASGAVGEPRPRPRTPTLRLERFLAMLERLGCEVRQGKGSEVVAYRTGGRIARIGRHTRNREVPSALAQRVLHQIGVTLAEWVALLP